MTPPEQALEDFIRLVGVMQKAHENMLEVATQQNARLLALEEHMSDLQLRFNSFDVGVKRQYLH